MLGLTSIASVLAIQTLRNAPKKCVYSSPSFKPAGLYGNICLRKTQQNGPLFISHYDVTKHIVSGCCSFPLPLFHDRRGDAHLAALSPSRSLEVISESASN